MSQELECDYVTGKTVYFLIRSSVGTIWNGSSLVTYVTGNLSTYVVLATEQGTSGYYTADFPALLTTAGVYNVVAKDRAGGSAAESDTSIASGDLQWAGTAVSYLFGLVKLAATGLDSITATDPAAVATTFPQMVVQLWRRFFKKTTLTSTQLLTYKDDNTTTETTQVVSDTGTLQTQGPAS